MSKNKAYSVAFFRNVVLHPTAPPYVKGFIAIRQIASAKIRKSLESNALYKEKL
jgi:hypothetical protein